MEPIQYKNINYGSITAGGDVHIGDKTYVVERDFQHSILFLRLEPDAAGQNAYTAQLFVRLQHPDKDFPEEYPNIPLTEAIALNVPTQLLRRLDAFQQTRRLTGDVFRVQGRTIAPWELYQEENGLADALFEVFFSGKIGETCARFLALADKQKLNELLLVISTDDEQAMNLPWEMVAARLLNGADWKNAHSGSIHNFGLVRTKEKSLAAFDIRGKNAGAGPLKMLFVTALPEDMGERDKLLEIEDEQRKLIQAVGNLEATGSQPKIVIEFLDNAALPEIKAALAARRHDILHISGHGAYLERLEKGVLYLEDERGDERKTSGAELGAVLRRHKSLKLLILSACETAIALKDGVVEGISAASGIPAILAMRFAVTDAGAKQFTTALYDTLAKGETLAHAVAQGREALWRAVAEQRKAVPDVYHIAEWFTPVLYLNQFVGAIVDVKKPYHLPDDFYPRSRFEAGERSRFIGQGFIGRKRYLIRLRRAFEQGQHVCLHGLGGMGKTTLAEAFVRNYRNRALKVLKFTGLEINVASLFERIYEHFCTLPGVEEGLKKSMAFVKDNKDMKPVERLGKLLHNCLDPNGTIFLFDNFEDQQTNGEGELQREIASPELLECLRYLCEHAPENCHALFTTRYKIVELDEQVTHFALDQLTYAEQYRLMNYATHPKRGNPFDKLGMPERESVIRRLDGHPRGYEFLEAILENTQTAWSDLEAKIGAVEDQVWENLLLERIYDLLEPEAQRVLQMAGVCFARTPIAALAAIGEQPATDLQPLLEHLHSWSLCVWDATAQTFEVHQLTREWLAKHRTDREMFRVWAFAAGEYFKAQPTWGDYELARRYNEMAEAWDIFVEMSFSLQGAYQLNGFYEQALELNQMVLEKNVNAKINAKALNAIGKIYFHIGQYNRALLTLEQSYFISRKLGDQTVEGLTLNNISQIYKARGEYDKALPTLEQSLLISQQISDKATEGIALDNIGQIHQAMGNYDTSMHYLKQSLLIHKQNADQLGECRALNNISQIYYNQGDYSTALHYLEQSLSISQQIGDWAGEGRALSNISQIYYVKSDYDAALRYLEQSLLILRQIGDRIGEVTTANNISQIYDIKGDYKTALSYLEPNLLISQQIGDRVVEGAILNNIGHIYYAQGDYDRALRYFEPSLLISQQIGDRVGEGTTLNNLAGITYAKGDYSTTLRYLEHSLSIQQQIGDRAGEGRSLSNISQIYNSKGDYKMALQYLEQSLSIRHQIGDIAGLATTLNNMGAIFWDQKNDVENAVRAFGQSYQILKKIGSPDIRHTESYLSKIIAQIGEARVLEIIQTLPALQEKGSAQERPQ